MAEREERSRGLVDEPGKVRPTRGRSFTRQRADATEVDYSENKEAKEGKAEK